MTFRQLQYRKLGKKPVKDCKTVQEAVHTGQNLSYTQDVRCHFVIVGKEGKQKDDWWMGQVIFCEGGARDPKVNSLFQVADVDTGVIRWINADEVNEVLWSMDGWGE